MAERVVAVRLVALTDQYKRAMADAAKANGPLEQSLTKTQRLGQSVSSVGDSLTRSVTLPLVAVGAAAAKLAIDFDQMFNRMVGTAGVAREEVDGLKKSVLDLAGETGRAPQELAEALFFIRSAGLSGQTALEALDVSARAAAAGLGDTVQVADAVTNAINAYGAANITAAEVTDVLTAAVTAGKAEASEMAPQFGRLLPIAAELGIEFADVAAGMAFLTQSSGDAAQSATSLGGVMNKLLKPSMQGAEALEEVGLSTDKVRQSISEQGLLGTLTMLREKLGDSGFNLLFEDAEALRGALQLTGVQADVAAQVFDDVADSSGALDEAFDATDGTARDLNKAWANLQAGLIQLGGVIAPVVSDIAALAAALFTAFNSLPDGAKKAAVWIGVLVAAIGPLLSVGGRLVTTYGRAMTALSNLALPAGRVSGAFSGAASGATTFRGSLGGLIGKLGPGLGIAGVLVLATLALDSYRKKKERARRVTNEFADAIAAEGGELEGVTGKIAATSDDFEKLRSAVRKTGEDFDTFVALAEGSRDPLEEVDEILRSSASLTLGSFEDRLERLAEAGNDFAAVMLRVAESSTLTDKEMLNLVSGVLELNEGMADGKSKVEDTEAAMDSVAGGSSELREELEAAGVETEALGEDFTSLTAAVEEYNKALQAMFDPLFGMVDALNGNAEASQALKDAQDAVAEATAEHGAKSREAKDAERELEQAHIDSAQSALDLQLAATTLAGAIESGEVSVSQAKNALNAWVEQGLITRETARRLGRQFEAAAGDADDLTGSVIAIPGRKDVKVTSNADSQAAAMKRVRDALASIPSVKNVDVFVRNIFETFESNRKRAGSYGGRQHGGPFQAGEIFFVGEGGPELVAFDRPGRVIPNYDPITRAALAGARPASGGAVTGGGRMDVVMRITGNGAMARLVHEGVKTGEIQLQANGQRVRVG